MRNVEIISLSSASFKGLLYPVYMKRAALATTTLWILCLLLPATAGYALNGTEIQSERDACMKALGLEPYMLEKGTYKIRVDACLEQRLATSAQNERQWRLQLRAKAVQERMSRNSRAALQRVIGLPETATQRSDRRKEVEAERAEYLELQRSNARPSRRSLKESSAISSQETRRTFARIARDRMDEALKACAEKTSHFHRSNCVRAKMRQLGSQK